MKLMFLLLFTLSCQAQHLEKEQKPSIDELIGSMIMIGFRGLEVSDSSAVVRDLNRYHIASLVLFDYDVPSKRAIRNIQSPEQVKKLCFDLRRYTSKNLLISVDQEGGKIRRLKEKHGFPKTVSAQFLGQLNDLKKTTHYSENLAKTLIDLGINLNLAPVVDLNVNPENPVIGKLERSFHSKAKRVSEQAKAFIAGHHKKHVGTVLKHFPGHGSSDSDSHLGLVDVSKTWSKSELIPYRDLIQSNTVDAIMSAHVFLRQYDRDYPATLSKKILKGILREDLNFRGVIFSDDMEMQAITKHFGFEEAIEQALNAGIDVLVFSNNGAYYHPNIAKRAFETMKKLYKDKKLSRKRMEFSYKRIRALQKKFLVK